MASGTSPIRRESRAVLGSRFDEVAADPLFGQALLGLENPFQLVFQRAIAGLIALVFLWVVPAVRAGGPRERPMAGAPTATEKYLCEQIAAGRVAHIETAFPDEASRVVRAVFLEELLTGSRKDCVIHRNGVQMEGAIVKDAVDLRNGQILSDVRLVHCRFDGEVSFARCSFSEGLALEECQFGGPVSFAEVHVERGLNLQKTAFRREVIFDQAQFDGVFLAGGVRFEDPHGVVSANSLKVGGSFWLTNAVFAGPVDLQFARVAENLRLDGAQFTNRSALVNFEGLKVESVGSFVNVHFEGYVSLKDAHFNILDFSGVHWPSGRYEEWLWLNGCNYQRISAGAERDSWNNLLKLLDRAAHRSAYSTDIYSSLAEYYRREGYPRQANQFFIAQKRREREEVLSGWEWCWSLFLDWFVGYGRSPERALFWSASIIAVGIFVFRPHRMEPRTTNLKTDQYSAFWYSVDLFLPLIKLQDAEMWKPRDNLWFARFWSRLHTMLGWALIPIAVAAWTGMLEK